MKLRIRAVAMTALCLVVGCSGGGSVSGVVTFNGTPLTSGTVTFHPTGSGPAGVGSIGSDGRYEIRIGNEKKIPSGDYVVTVDASESVQEPPPTAKGKPQPPKAPKRLIPELYGDKATTDLRATVTSGTNTVNLELKGTAPKPKGK